jgi:hypothetical protein
VQEITSEDCLAEGAPIDVDRHRLHHGQPMVRVNDWTWQTVRLWYHRLWDKLHGEGSWDKNPEVVVIKFMPIFANIERISP